MSKFADEDQEEPEEETSYKIKPQVIGAGARRWPAACLGRTQLEAYQLPACLGRTQMEVQGCVASACPAGALATAGVWHNMQARTSSSC